MICSKLKQLQEMSLCMQRKWINAHGYQAFKTTKMIHLWFIILGQNGRTTCSKCAWRIQLQTKFGKSFTMLKTIPFIGKMNFNLNIGLVSKSPSLCFWLSKYGSIGTRTLTLGLWLSIIYTLMMTILMTICFCNIVLDYTCKSFKVKIIPCLWITLSSQMAPPPI